MWRIGDMVTRKSYGKDVCFVVVELDDASETAILKGLDVRLMADAPYEDLEQVSDDELRQFEAARTQVEGECLRLIQSRRAMEHEKRSLRRESRFQANPDFFERPGRVLHLDGDGTYLKKCMTMYRELGIRAIGQHVPETQMPSLVNSLLQQYEPDILIITGHDGVIRKGKDWADIQNYRNSHNFVRTVANARKHARNMDDLVIIAGACQSHFEAILDAGANFASSPQRIMIHALDPVFIAEKIAFTPIHETVDLYEAVKSTYTGTDGIGGLESRGKYRLGVPKSTY
ncbi:sporulation peptidase YabG [Alicyclobacillus acidoterrestris]|uniref:Sporulation peptidase YabG n=1 Tax=Alicyclobacillus acidoterrestris (strain ATCC 49025 / DSM 3922 / CIP 106132 / NCIMB 13137 / GD3B) TaxID=1356854 RepID=T0DUN3_ALIAG|nr:sporulation peptidase YabG [Alicyclobacillus acidoterrestris]EPZ53206.1 peptidase [Alicyclobacillus acidoterrestris ATCC 49025]UNO49225.1 sporulation peptidase YabG [Alicyclobacillus acidoterrestris]